MPINVAQNDDLMHTNRTSHNWASSALWAWYVVVGASTEVI